MQLTLTVSDDLARKIKGLSVLSGLSASDITNLFAEEVDRIVTGKILESIGVAPVQFASSPSSFDATNHVQRSLLEDDADAPLNPKQYVSHDDDDEMESYAEEVSDVVEEEEPLPELMQKELKDMAKVKDKDGNESKYEDDFMNDIQEEAEEYEGQDDVIAAAAGSSNPDREGFADDAPVESSTPDVLPVDFGLGKVNNNPEAASQFFDLAFSGRQGDKTKRNGLAKKRRS